MAEPIALPDPLVAELAAIVGRAHVVDDPALLAGRLQDWTGRWRGQCRCAVSPAAGPEVAAVLRVCAADNIHVVIQGGNTGLAGGAVPSAGDVLLLTHRLRSLDPPDEVAHTVVVGAGVTLAELQRHLQRHGLELPVDLAARESATVGGMAATNAGGLRVLHDGDMRRHVLCVDAYAADGEQIAVLHPLVKDNTGYSISSLLVGSEGTLAVITRLLLRVVPRVLPGAVAVLGLPDLDRVTEVVAAVRRAVPDLRAAELVSAATLALVASAQATAPPVVAPWLALFETARSPSAIEQLTEAVSGALAAAGLPDAPVAAAQDAAGMRALWMWRDGVTDAIARTAVDNGLSTVKLDVTLPTSRLAQFVRDVEHAMADRPEMLFVFGHIGDGNLHVNVLGPVDALGEIPNEQNVSRVAMNGVEDIVLTLVAAHGGSISAEHGIGRAKVPWFPLARTAEERAAMLAIKKALDPASRLGRALWVAPERTSG